ncbi:MAG: LemA family protein [Acidithiobacillales bacterium SG8_45]|jgi:LemA protein|nr:MAG: LemA family protein [Acidithiobacillales bacterium SG8_45]
MEISSIIFWAVLIGLGLYVVATYNSLVRLKHDVSRAWSNIDVLMKQRHDELPKLVETCKQYMQYEKDVLERVVKARASVAEARMAGDVGALGAAETEMRIGLGNLFAVAENYPELKANETFQHLQQRISTLETQISDRREFYNNSVNANNVRVEQFPDLIVARLFGFGLRDLLEFSESEKADVNVKELFNS